MFQVTVRQSMNIGCNPFLAGFAAGFTGCRPCFAAPIFAYPAMPVMVNPYMMMPLFSYQTPGYVPAPTMPQFPSFAPTFSPSFVPSLTPSLPQVNYNNPFATLNNNTVSTPAQNTQTQEEETENETENTRPAKPVKEMTLSKNNNEYGPEFLAKVKEIAKKINCDYKDLLGVMNSESGINAKAQNKNGGASGLIQFMPKTAEALGTTTNALRDMSPIDQLDYVEKFMVKNKKMFGFGENERLSGGQLYALVFLPARAKREVLTQSGENYYSANKGLDANHDGKITKTELDERVKSKYVSDKSFLA